MLKEGDKIQRPPLVTSSKGQDNSLQRCKTSTSIVEIGSTLRHSLCRRLSITNRPSDNLTCSICMEIPQEDDFRLTILQEDFAPEKKGSEDTRQDR